MLCLPSHKDLRCVIKGGLLHNFSVTVSDLDNSVDIFGENVALIKGTTFRKHHIVSELTLLLFPKRYWLGIVTLPWTLTSWS